MTNISGTTGRNDLCLLDADAIIGLIKPDDALHERALKISTFLLKHKIETYWPFPIVLEAATALARALNNPDLAKEVLENYPESKQVIDLEVADIVANIYDPRTSKKNTPFDHYLLALARKNNIKYIFSFDDFYTKNGLTLLEDLLKNNP